MNRRSTLRSNKKEIEMADDSPSNHEQTKKKKPGKGKSKLLRIDSSNFVIGKMNAFDNDYEIVGEIG